MSADLFTRIIDSADKRGDAPGDRNGGSVRNAASFYTEIEKIFTRIAAYIDKKLPTSEAWHRDLLHQMADSTDARPTVVTADLVRELDRFKAFRHLFRGASITLMRWDKISPLMEDVDWIHNEVFGQLTQFQVFLQTGRPYNP